MSAWYLLSPGQGTVIEDSEFDGQSSLSNDSAISGGGWTGRRLNIHHVIDGLKMSSGSTLEDSYIHDLFQGGGSHNDGIQIMQGSGIVIRHNRIAAGMFMNAAVWIATDFGAISNVLTENNWLSGGGYTYRMNAKSSTITNTRLLNNHFTRASYQYGVFINQGGQRRGAATCWH